MHGEDSGGGHPGGVHSGSGRSSSKDSMDPLGPMSMPKILSRVADRAGHGQQGAGTVAALLFLLSVLAIIIAFTVLFIVHAH
jgi:hypothetical protein